MKDDKRNPFFVDPFYKSLNALAGEICRKHKCKKADLKSDGLGYGWRTRNVIDARGEFAYRAYSTGRHALRAIGDFCGIKSPHKRQIIWNRILGYCKRHALEPPRFGRINPSATRRDEVRSDAAQVSVPRAEGTSEPESGTD